MKKQSLNFLLVGVILTGCAAPATNQNSTAAALTKAQDQFLEKVDVDYAYNLAVKMEDIRSNAVLGYRTAGSEAEFLTGEMLKKEMETIGLQDISKDEFTLDGWTFEKAELTVPELGEDVIQMGGYQTTFNTDGPEEFTIIDAGRGTEDDLKDLDVEGKLVLIDINQSDDWWINYPAYEAHLAGAAAVLAAQNGGYATINDDALNAQDVCGPEDAPAFSISKNDADEIRDIMEEKGTNELTVTLDAKSTVERDTKSYNVVGKIPGRTDDMILMSAHYDSYFSGFQDDNVAIALMLGIAKALVESGYQPEKTLVFSCMAAEEWGIANTRYDWSTGAYNQIFRVHPEWAGKTIADINFELPALNKGDADQIRASYELKSFLEAFNKTVPAVDGIFEEGIEIIVPTQTWSDDFSLSIAGIPTTVTALRGDFSETTYHSQMDTKDTYSEEALLFHLNMYGMLMLAYDHCAASPLDFTTRLEALQEVSSDTLTEGQKDALNKAIEPAKKASAEAWQKVQDVNNSYAEALTANDTDKAQKILDDNKALRTNVLKAFKLAQDNLVKLTWEDAPQFPHEHSTNNIVALEGALEALKNNNPAKALDEYLYLVDNNWYAYDWSKETFNYFTDYVLDQPADRLMWGAGRVQGHNDLYDVINSLQEKDENADFNEEIKTLEDCLSNEKKMLQDQVDLEVKTVNELTDMLNHIAE